MENGLNRLNSNRTISRKTKLTITECMSIRDLLQKMAIDGQSLIQTKPGTSKLNFDKNQIKDLILTF